MALNELCLSVIIYFSIKLRLILIIRNDQTTVRLNMVDHGPNMVRLDMFDHGPNMVRPWSNSNPIAYLTMFDHVLNINVKWPPRSNHG